jgi:hypothetical protein
MAYGTDPSRALAILASRDQPDQEGRLLAKFLLRGIASQRFGNSIVQGLCKTACQWNNMSLWLKAVDLCRQEKILDILSARRIVNAIEVFGLGERIQEA